MRFQTLVEQLGKDQPRVRARNDGVQGRVAGGAMIGVVDIALPGPATSRIGRKDDIRLRSADPPCDLPAKIEGRLQGTVIVAEEEDVLDTQLHGCGPLLRVADLGQPLRCHRRIAAATIAVGKDQVGHLPAFLGPFRHRSGGAELGVVRVRHHDEHPGKAVGRRRHQAGVGIAVETS